MSSSCISARDFTASSGGSIIHGNFDRANIHLHNQDISTKDRFEHCRNNLFLTNPNMDREALISLKGERAEGTCEWIQGDQRYQSWRTGNERFLWISGGPGKGKTILSIFLTRELERGEQSAQTIYYFCTSSDGTRNNAAAVLRGLIWHMVDKNNELTEHLLDDLDNSNKAQRALSSRETLWSIFVKVSQDPGLGATFCVLDGLDEMDSDSQKWLIQKIANTARTAGLGQLRLVVVSRHVLGLHRFMRINLDSDADDSVNHDIKSFVQVRVDELAERIQLTGDSRQMIEHTLTQRARGTFLWVGFAMEELLEKETLLQIKTSLAALPRGLSGIYTRMLLQMDFDFRPTALLLLRWVTMAITPLTLPELAAATNVRSLDDMDVEQIIHDQVKMCKPFLELRNGRVSLVHQSAKDYLTSYDASRNLAPEQFQINPEESHSTLASRCLACIEQSLPRNHFVSIADFYEPKFSDPETCSSLLRYAICNWPQHARLASDAAVHLLIDQHFFSERSLLRKRWWKAYTEHYRLPSRVEQPSLHIACCLGINAWVEHLLGTQMIDPDCKDEDMRTPLSWAAMEGREAVVKLLLETGKVDANSRDKRGRSPLSYAASFGRDAVVELMLRSDKVDANSRDGRGETALEIAAHQGQYAAVKLLLASEKVDVNSRSDDGAFPLSQASRHGKEAVVKLMLQSERIDATLKDKGRTALLVAAREGREAVVKVMLDSNKINVNSRNRHGQTALAIVAREGRTTIVKVMLESSKVDTNSKDNQDRTPLSLAARYGRETVVMLMLRTNKVDANSGDKDGHSPLSHAAYCGRAGVVKLMLESQNIDADSQDDNGWSALSLATINGQAAVVKLMLESDKVDANSKDVEGRTALAIAASYGNDTVVKLLLESGKVDANSKDKQGRTPLSYAIHYRQDDVVKQMLKFDKCETTTIRSDDVFPRHASVYRTTTKRTNFVRDISVSQRNSPKVILLSDSVNPDTRVERPVRKVVFSITSHDQGFADNRDRGSWTWFTARRVRSDEGAPLTDPGKITVDLAFQQTREVCRNPTAASEWHTQRVTWRADSDDDAEAEWVSTLAIGDRVALEARAAFSGWINIINSASITLQTFS